MLLFRLALFLQGLAVDLRAVRQEAGDLHARILDAERQVVVRLRLRRDSLVERMVDPKTSRKKMMSIIGMIMICGLCSILALRSFMFAFSPFLMNLPPMLLTHH